jgi:hypothetical protein
MNTHMQNITHAKYGMNAINAQCFVSIENV